MADWLGILWLVVLLAANAFFVGAEFAVISARRSQIEPLAEAGNPRAKTALYAMEHATLMLATSQLGITVCSLLILNVSEPAIHHLLEGPIALTGLSEEFVSTIAFIITLVLVSFLHVVFGEMVPKNLSFSIPDRAVLVLAPPLVAVARIFGWLIGALNGISNGILRLFGVEPKNEASSAFTLDEVSNIVTQSQREGVLHDKTGALNAAFEFTSKVVRDVAVPVSELVSITDSATPRDIERLVARHGFSRYIVVDEDGQPDGYLHLKDILTAEQEHAQAPVPAKRIRQLVSMFDSTELEDALASMRTNNAHVARTFSRDGTTTGVLFLEDIIEELVGEVQDATRRN